MRRYEHLDFLRGVAALLVLFGHLRGYLVESYEGARDVFTMTFYLVTGIPHQAVIIFFALSGFLVGGGAIEKIVGGGFSWGIYLARRLTRLWIVLIPALVVTFLFDKTGVYLTGGAGYDGSFANVYPSGPGPAGGETQDELSVRAFAGSVLFLQTIFVPTFGSNGPTWSLANEFWYYIAIPLAVWIVFSRASLVARGIGLALLIAIVAFIIPWEFYPGAAIWLAGALSAVFSRARASEAVFRYRLARWGALLLIPVALVLSKVLSSFGDLWLGLFVAAALPGLVHARAGFPGYARLAKGMSEISYSLYLTHIPLLTFIVMVGFAPDRYELSLPLLGVFLVLFGVAVAWSIAFWWLFERHTDLVFALVREKLGRPGSRRVA